MGVTWLVGETGAAFLQSEQLNVCFSRTGDKGDKGDTGATGVTGATGSKGDTGEIGPTGQPGAAASKGDTGDTGPAGPAGTLGVLAPIVNGITGNANGATLVGSTLNLDAATPFFGGVVTTLAQAFSGTKTFLNGIGVSGPVNINGDVGVTGNMTVSGTLTTNNLNVTGTVTGTNLTGTNTGNVTLAAIGATPNANAATLSGANGQVLNLQPASTSFGGVVTTGAQSFSGAKTFTSTVTATNISGTNTGDVTFAAIGATPNANAASITGQQITLQPASASFGGVVTTGTQTFAGAKTFTGAITASNISGTNTGDVGVGAIGAVPNGAGATITGQLLNLQPANATFGGVVTSGAQTFGGLKAFGAGLTLPTTGGTASTLNYYEEYTIPTVGGVTYSLTTFQTDVAYVFGTGQAGINGLWVNGVSVPSATSTTISGVKLTRIGRMVTLTFPPFNIQNPGGIGNQGLNLLPRNAIPARFLPAYDTRFYCDMVNTTLGRTTALGTSDTANVGFASNWVSSGQENCDLVVRAAAATTRWPTVNGSLGLPVFGDVFVRVVSSSATIATNTGSYDSISVSWTI